MPKCPKVFGGGYCSVCIFFVGGVEGDEVVAGVEIGAAGFPACIAEEPCQIALDLSLMLREKQRRDVTYIGHSFLRFNYDPKCSRCATPEILNNPVV